MASEFKIIVARFLFDSEYECHWIVNNFWCWIFGNLSVAMW